MKRAKRASRLQEERAKALSIWRDFVAADLQPALEAVINKLGKKELPKLTEIMTSVYQYEGRLKKENEEFKAEKEKRWANLIKQDERIGRPGENSRS